MVKETFLHDAHIKLGARMVPFAGWDMPVQYSGIIEEHHCVRQNVGLFDVSHMGEVFISGQDSLNFLQKLVPQNIKKLEVGNAIYCQMTNQNGGIIDDLIIYKLEDKNDSPYFMLIINASRVDEDIQWLNTVKDDNTFDIEIDNQSDNYSLLAVQGPLSAEVINKMGLHYAYQPHYFSIVDTQICGFDVLVSRTGYTGEDGFEILVKNEHAKSLWDKVLEEGKEFGIKPIGLGARDTLRLEAALLLYGQDMDEETTPVESSLGWSVPKDKEDHYNGKNAILQSEPQKRLVGFKMVDKAIARHGYEIYSGEDRIGVVTSGGVSPTLGANIGLGFIDAKYTSKVGTEILIKVRNRYCKAEVVKRPFVPKSHKKLTEIQS